MKKPTIYLNDYRPPDYLFDYVELDFVLAEKSTRVRSTLAVRRNGADATPRDVAYAIHPAP